MTRFTCVATKYLNHLVWMNWIQGGKCSKIKLLKLAIKALRRADSGDSIFMNCI